MKKKFSIDIGHNIFPDTGAVGVRREDDLTLAVGTEVIKQLQVLGHIVVSTLPHTCVSVNDSLKRRCDTSNCHDIDVFCSIHFNASAKGEAYGSEVYYTSNKGKKYAEPVLKELVKLGFTNRGVKQANFYVLKNTKAPAILVEVAFCDNKKDMMLVDKIGIGIIATSIVCGLIANQE